MKHSLKNFFVSKDLFENLFVPLLIVFLFVFWFFRTN